MLRPSWVVRIAFSIAVDVGDGRTKTISSRSATTYMQRSVTRPTRQAQSLQRVLYRRAGRPTIRSWPVRFGKVDL